MEIPSVTRGIVRTSRGLLEYFQKYKIGKNFILEIIIRMRL